MDLYADIMQGINEAIAYEKGELNVRTVTMTLLPVKAYTAQEVKTIRKKAKLSQMALANVLGVSVKTVEAWEAGTNTPSGPSSRLLSLIENDPEFPKKAGILVTA